MAVALARVEVEEKVEELESVRKVPPKVACSPNIRAQEPQKVALLPQRRAE